jgi:predicted DNA-binding transcriptional regulator AlpA
MNPTPRCRGKLKGMLAMTAMTRDELLSLPAVVDLKTAAHVLGIGRTAAYELVRTGQWPTPVLRVGRLIKVPTAPLLELVGVADQEGPAAGTHGAPT